MSADQPRAAQDYVCPHGFPGRDWDCCRAERDIAAEGEARCKTVEEFYQLIRMARWECITLEHRHNIHHCAIGLGRAEERWDRGERLP